MALAGGRLAATSAKLLNIPDFHTIRLHIDDSAFLLRQLCDEGDGENGNRNQEQGERGPARFWMTAIRRFLVSARPNPRVKKRAPEFDRGGGLGTPTESGCRGEPTRLA